MCYYFLTPLPNFPGFATASCVPSIMVWLLWGGKFRNSSMAGLEELKKKLTPLFDAEKGFSPVNTLGGSDSDMVSLSWPLGNG